MEEATATNMTSLSVGIATAQQVQTAIDWAAAEGWNPGKHDASCFRLADPDGFFAGTIDGQMVSTISAVRYGADFAFVGLYIVHPEWRGRGHGWATWQHALATVAGRNVALDGVPAREADYVKSGFRTAHANIRYRMETGSRGLTHLPPIRAEELEAVFRFDRRFFPAERSAFLRNWLTQPDIVTCCDIQDGTLQGVGAMRPCQEGWKVGPLFATSPASARNLFSTLLEQAWGGPIFLDVPGNNPDALKLADEYGMEPVFETRRMYTRGEPDIDTRGIYGITSFELG